MNCPYLSPAPGRCGCRSCWPIDHTDPQSVRMIVCSMCGNKRCPKAANHENACTNSNEPGQPVEIISHQSHSIGGVNFSFTVGRIK